MTPRQNTFTDYFAFALTLFITLFALLSPASAQEKTTDITQGQLRIVGNNSQATTVCPLKHTDVRAEISGFLARVTVTQEFHNSTDDKIEAVYVFPLPQKSAVDEMTMSIGGRTVRGEIKRRTEARQIFEQARNQGRVAALLDQQRPNIFMQSVTNIMPGEEVRVTISYVEMLMYEDGVYEFIFPMVVGPRYIPATMSAEEAARITPPRVPKGMRPGHDISLEISLDAGVPIENLTSELHEIEIDRNSNHQAVVTLKEKAVIPDKDFVLHFDVGGQRINDALLTHRTERGGFFTLILQPPDKPAAQDVSPKELVFVLDTSGSMGGLPMETAKKTILSALDGLYEADTFNIITFAGDTHILFEKPVPATKENLSKAVNFINGRYGSGGTEMMKAIQAALADTDTQDHIRIVCFITDGEVGNDMQIIAEVQKHPKARVFSFGIGNSVNRFLLDKMAEYGRGEVEYVLINRGSQKDAETASAAAKRFHQRVRSPLLTDIRVDWNGLPVADVYPKHLPDLFSAKPLHFTGRFTGSGRGVITLRGRNAGTEIVREIPVEFPTVEPQHDVLATLWARTRIDDLMSQDFTGIQGQTLSSKVQEAITQLGLDFRLMTQFTSFVAVGDVVTSPGETPQRVETPVSTPNGTESAFMVTGAVTETVIVTSSASQVVNIEAGSVAQTVETRSVESLPLNVQRPAELIKLAESATPT